MSIALTPLRLGGLTLDNRIVLPPMCQYSAFGGIPNDWHFNHYLQMALSGAGSFVVEATAVEGAGLTTLYDLGLFKEQQARAFRQLVNTCKRYSPDIKVGIQLSHGGRKASLNPPFRGGETLKSSLGGYDVFAPSSIQRTEGAAVPIALTHENIERIIGSFKLSVRMADKVGFDFVEIHMAHGYLIHQFLSPISNKRSDMYGGSMNNRLRFALRVAEEARSVWPKNKAIGARVTGSDWLPGGLGIEECQVLVQRLEDIGFDYVDVSSGGIIPITNRPEGSCFQVHLARQIKAKSKLKIRSVGGITTADEVDKILASGDADLVGIGRGYLRDNHWLWKNYPTGDFFVPTQYARAFQF